MNHQLRQHKSTMHNHTPREDVEEICPKTSGSQPKGAIVTFHSSQCAAQPAARRGATATPNVPIHGRCNITTSPAHILAGVQSPPATEVPVPQARKSQERTRDHRSQGCSLQISVPHVPGNGIHSAQASHQSEKLALWSGAPRWVFQSQPSSGSRIIHPVERQFSRGQSPVFLQPGYNRGYARAMADLCEQSGALTHWHTRGYPSASACFYS